MTQVHRMVSVVIYEINCQLILAGSLFKMKLQLPKRGLKARLRMGHGNQRHSVPVVLSNSMIFGDKYVRLDHEGWCEYTVGLILGELQKFAAKVADQPANIVTSMPH